MSEILNVLDVNSYNMQSMVAGVGKLQEKTATPSTSQQVVEPDTGYDGLSQVTVSAVTSSIDSNIIPTNIRAGVSVLGVQGNLEPDKPDQSKTVTPTTSQQTIVADTGYELAQVIVEAVPDETAVLNAQDTALSTQETKIAQLEQALNNKVALDLTSATSDANATANDIAKDKTAYVNGIKVVGTYDGPSIKSIGDIKDSILLFANYMDSVLAHYPVYTNEPLTLYTPDLQEKTYIIHKNNEGKYRIIWTSMYYVAIQSSTSIGIRTAGIDSFNYWVNPDFEHFANIPSLGTTPPNQIIHNHYSNYFDTLEELIQEITKTDGNITYYTTSSMNYTGALDTPYLIPYTNTNVFDERNLTKPVIMSQRLSFNETILVKGS